MELPVSSLVFKARRQQPVLVAPSRPTPHELKPLSDIDDQQGLRYQVSAIQLYRASPRREGKDPARVIREALGRALVFYYPFAGRLREGPNRKLAADCTGEGVLFIEADADVRLEQFGESPHPPFPCLEELLYDVPGSDGILHCPLLLIQVTRLVCGGFILALRFNHTMADAFGMAQFMAAMGEMARGIAAPLIMPVWERELLNARQPPRITCIHREYDDKLSMKANITTNERISCCSLFFGPRQFLALRNQLPPHLCTSSRIELLMACAWKCWTIAHGLALDEEARMNLAINIRRHDFWPSFPIGYYGNGFVTPAVVSSSRRLCEGPLAYAVELVRRAKEKVTQEYVQSVTDLMVLRGRPSFMRSNAWIVTDVARAGFQEVDFGWGRPVYGGFSGQTSLVKLSLFAPGHSEKGEEGVVVLVYLTTGPMMDKFRSEIQSMTDPTTSSFVPSCL